MISIYLSGRFVTAAVRAAGMTPTTWFAVEDLLVIRICSPVR
jgi:hypothetical protein